MRRAASRLFIRILRASNILLRADNILLRDASYFRALLLPPVYPSPPNIYIATALRIYACGAMESGGGAKRIWPTLGGASWNFDVDHCFVYPPIPPIFVFTNYTGIQMRNLVVYAESPEGKTWIYQNNIQ